MEVHSHDCSTALNLIENDSTVASSLAYYMKIAGKIPVLSPEEEQHYAKQWFDDHDESAAHKLTVSHMRLVVKIAFQYKNYGAALAELVSEGTIGLIKAVKRFNPYKNVRLASYAVWWIKAYINEYIISSWSVVKIGTTKAQRKLFFHLRRCKQKILHYDGVEQLTDAHIAEIAEQLCVSKRDVIAMDHRLSSSDISLDAPVHADGTHPAELQDFIPDPDSDHESAYITAENRALQQKLYCEALKTLTQREREIIILRKLQEPSKTLEALGKFYSVSPERIRQIQNQAMTKLKRYVSAHYS